LKDLVIIGGGAAGYFAASEVLRKKPNASVVILEKTGKVLSKVKVSGGGRCNVTHACPEVEQLLQKYPRGTRFLKKAFYQFATKYTIQWFANNGVRLHTEKDVLMFTMKYKSGK
jgi:predicted flavoprotein YhiN